MAGHLSCGGSTGGAAVSLIAGTSASQQVARQHSLWRLTTTQPRDAPAVLSVVFIAAKSALP